MKTTDLPTIDKFDAVMELVNLIGMAASDLDHADQRQSIKMCCDVLDDLLKQMQEEYRAERAK